MAKADEIGMVYDNETLGSMVLDYIDKASLYSDSVWWHPTRAGINNLIRTLRKARDAAFGRDE